MSLMLALTSPPQSVPTNNQTMTVEGAKAEKDPADPMKARRLLRLIQEGEDAAGQLK